MNSPVIDLQQQASDSAVKLPDLLRKALMIASKLGLDDFKQWITYEVKGYPPSDDVPDYRVCRSDYYFHNPYRGLCPIEFTDLKTKEAFCLVSLRESVESLEHALEKTDDGRIGYTVPTYAQRHFHESGDLYGMPVYRFINANAITHALGAVRTVILEWALRLESEGILGEGLVFSMDEKNRAQSGQTISIGSMQGIFGNVSHSHVQQNFSHGIGPGDLSALIASVRQIGATDVDLAELQDALNVEPVSVSQSTFGPKVSAWMGKMVTRAAQGALTVTVNVASAVLATYLKAYYGIPE